MNMMDQFLELFALKDVEPEQRHKQEAAMSGAIRELRRYTSIERAVEHGRAGRKRLTKPPQFMEAYKEWRLGDLPSIAAASMCGVSVATWYKWVHDEELRQHEERQQARQGTSA